MSDERKYKGLENVSVGEIANRICIAKMRIQIVLCYKALGIDDIPLDDLKDAYTFLSECEGYFERL